MGNHDAAAIGAKTSMNDTAAAAIAWTRPRLSEASRQFLAALPMTATLEDVLFVHADASHPQGWIYVLDAASAMQSLLAVKARVTFCRPCAPAAGLLPHRHGQGDRPYAGHRHGGAAEPAAPVAGGGGCGGPAARRQSGRLLPDL